MRLSAEELMQHPWFADMKTRMKIRPYKPKLSPSSLSPRLMDMNSDRSDKSREPEIRIQERGQNIPAQKARGAQQRVSPPSTPQGEKLSSVAQVKSATPRSENMATPRSENILTPQSENMSTPRSENVPTPQSENMATPRSEKILTPQSENMATPRSEKILTSQSENLSTSVQGRPSGSIQIDELSLAVPESVPVKEESTSEQEKEVIPAQTEGSGIQTEENPSTTQPNVL